jgi:type II secretory pathway component PulK
MATPEVLQQALMLAGAQGGEIGAISSAIVDWIDADDNEGVNGAESPYYQSQDPPYFAKNGPMDDLSELLKVRGVTKEMYYGTESNDAGGEAQGSFQRRDRLGRLVQGTTPTVGLCKVFTTFSSGRKANVNTARTEVLQALGFDEAMAVELVRRRDEAPFTSVNELKGQVEQMAPQFLPIVDNWCEARGSIFEVEITPKVGFRRTFHAIIGPGNNPREMQVFSFFWKWNEEENSSR